MGLHLPGYRGPLVVGFLAMEPPRKDGDTAVPCEEEPVGTETPPGTPRGLGLEARTN